MGSKSNSRDGGQTDSPIDEDNDEHLPDDIILLEDRTIHGWIEKKRKGGLFTNWRRLFVTVE